MAVLPTNLSQQRKVGKTPVSETQPAGSDVRGTERLELIREEINKLQSPQGSELNWGQVIEWSNELLLDFGKDINVAGYLLRGLFEKHGYAGLSAGLQILHDMIGCYWEGLFPSIERVRARQPAFVWINEEMTRRLENVKPNKKDATDIHKALKILLSIEKQLKEHMGDNAPQLGHLRRLLTEYAGRYILPRAAKPPKPVPTPEPEPVVEPEPEPEEALEEADAEQESEPDETSAEEADSEPEPEEASSEEIEAEPDEADTEPEPEDDTESATKKAKPWWVGILVGVLLGVLLTVLLLSAFLLGKAAAAAEQLSVADPATQEQAKQTLQNLPEPWGAVARNWYADELEQYYFSAAEVELTDEMTPAEITAAEDAMRAWLNTQNIPTDTPEADVPANVQAARARLVLLAEKKAEVLAGYQAQLKQRFYQDNYLIEENLKYCKWLVRLIPPREMPPLSEEDCNLRAVKQRTIEGQRIESVMYQLLEASSAGRLEAAEEAMQKLRRLHNKHAMFLAEDGASTLASVYVRQAAQYAEEKKFVETIEAARKALALDKDAIAAKKLIAAYQADYSAYLLREASKRQNDLNTTELRQAAVYLKRTKPAMYREVSSDMADQIVERVAIMVSDDERLAAQLLASAKALLPDSEPLAELEVQDYEQLYE